MIQVIRGVLPVKMGAWGQRRTTGWPRTGIPKNWRCLAAFRTASRCDVRLLATVRSPRMQALETLLFAAHEPVAIRRLAKLANLDDVAEARRMIGQLNAMYDQDQTPFRIEELAGGFQLLTRPRYRPLLDRLAVTHDDLQLSPSTLETLAIIAYRQPICRADIEAIRGVQLGEIIKQLMDRGLVRIAGREESLGRPFLYGTTNRFLELFGLRGLSELPMVELLRRPDGGAHSTATADAVPPVEESSVIIVDEEDDGFDEEE